MAKRLDLEHQEQRTLVEWADCVPTPDGLEKIGDYMYAVPNGSNKSPAAAAKFKREGLRSGVPDVVLAYPYNGFHGLYIEMKKQRQHYRGKAEAANAISESQNTWLNRLNSVGYETAVCYGFEEAKQAITEYLNHGG